MILKIENYYTKYYSVYNLMKQNLTEAYINILPNGREIVWYKEKDPDKWDSRGTEPTKK
jgi:hypothetical protein